MSSQKKLISTTNPAARASITNFDRSWADLHGLPAAKPLTPQAIGEFNKQSLLTRAIKSVVRVFKSVALYSTTNYSWSTSWIVAARSI